MSDTSNLWEVFYASLGFHQEEDTTGTLRTFVEAWCEPLQLIHDLVRERDDMPPWAVLLDPDLCPVELLPYLAQFVGVVITPEMTEAQIRAEITHPTGWRRGQPESIQIATRRTLKPVVDGEDLFVIIRPNRPATGWHYVRTLASQTPDPSRTAAVLREAVPAWSALDYQAISGLTYADLESSKYLTYAELEASPIQTYKALEEALPGDL